MPQVVDYARWIHHPYLDRRHKHQIVVNVIGLGKDETKTEKLKSILAQLEYSHLINIWLYVPLTDHLYSLCS